MCHINALGIFYRDPFYMFTFHSKTQYIIDLDCLCRFITTAALCIEIAAHPAVVKYSVALARRFAIYPYCGNANGRDWDNPHRS